MEIVSRKNNRQTDKVGKDKKGKKASARTTVSTTAVEVIAPGVRDSGMASSVRGKGEERKAPIFLVLSLIVAVALLIISGLYCFTLMNRIDDLKEELEAKRINSLLAQERANEVAQEEALGLDPTSLPFSDGVEGPTVAILEPEIAAPKVDVFSYVSVKVETKPKPVVTVPKTTTKPSNGSNSAGSSSSSRGGVSLVSWSQMNSIWPRGATATLIDVRTGKTLQIKRQGGRKHADIEPLTAKDTQTLKECYGGKWSWDRRPTLLLYGGKYYASSMNGYPHGADTIASNNYAGQNCLHFLGSTTHVNESRTDPQHQACVQEAYRNGSKWVK